MSRPWTRVTRDRTRVSLVALTASFLGILLLVSGADLWLRHRQALDVAKRRADNLALLLSDHMRRTVAVVDAALVQIAIESQRIGGPAAPAEAWAPILSSAAAVMSGVSSLTVTDASGVVSHSTIQAAIGQSRKDQYLFKRLQSDPDAGIVASTPFRGLISRRMAIPLGRRLRRTDGAFDGTVVAMFLPDELRGFYRSVDVGERGKIWVLHPDGLLLLREPSAENSIGETITDNPLFRAYKDKGSMGILRSPLEPGGAIFLSAYRSLSAPPLIIGVSLSEDEQLAGWHRDLTLRAGLTALMALVIGLASFQILRQLDARLEAERALVRRDRELLEAQRIANLGSLRFRLPDLTARVSPQINDIFGWPSEREEVPFSELLSRLAEKERDELSQALRRCIEEKGSYRVEFRVERPDGPGRICWSEGHWEGIEGAADGILSVVQDVTERKTVEERLRQAQKMEAIGQLTGGVAHDFNNLLTVILGNSELLMEELGDHGSARELAETCKLAALRAATLTSRLLTFARRQPLRPTDFDLNGLVREMNELIRRTLGEHIEIRTFFAETLWPVLADRSQVETALLNLVVNARDAMPDGGRLSIETGNAHLDDLYVALNPGVTPGDFVMLSVADTGTGMSAAVAARVFEPFFTTKEQGKGTGLGLAMVYGFVKQSGGHVKIYSEPGVGTVVKMYLPRSAKDRVEARPASNAAEADLRGHGETVLVVEDDPLVRSHVAAQIAALGYSVVEAMDGRAALAVLDSTPKVDLLFTDVILPGGMNGRQLAEEAQRRRAGLKVVYTSGYSENVFAHQERIGPGLPLLTKPYGKAELARMLWEVLAR